jgi:hypothetical protein
MNYVCIHTYIETYSYVHYIGLQSTWFIFFPHPHGHHAHPTVETMTTGPSEVKQLNASPLCFIVAVG